MWNSSVNLCFLLFLIKQIRNVRSSQEALKVALGGLDNAKSRAEIERWTLAAAELKEKADQLVLVLQVGMLCITTIYIN